MVEKSRKRWSEMDFEHLEGKKFFFWHKGDYVLAEVALIDYNIGITVVKAQDKEYKLLCVNKKERLNDSHLYDVDFWFTVRRISEGDWRERDVEICLYIFYRFAGQPGGSMAPCAFSGE